MPEGHTEPMPERGTMTTYRMADGSLLYDEYAFMTEADGFEESVLDSGVPMDVIREEWVLKERTLLTIKPPGWDEKEEEDG